MTALRLALADDDELVRAGIAALLEHHEDLSVTVQAGSGGELVRAVTGRGIDAILLDIRMPGLDGIATLRELRRAGVEAPTAMLTTFRHETLLEQAVAAGARGFLLKSDAPDDLARHVRALAAGGAVFSPRVAGWLIRTGAVRRLQAKHQALAAVASLTERQRDVLALLATGAGNGEIAATLHLSEGTVKQYLRDVFDRLGVGNRVQAALIGFQAELVNEERGDLPPLGR